MFNRKIEKNLLEWKQNHRRKPLVLRGARQTGKTTLIRKFAANFDNFIELNLEIDSTRRLFSEVTPIKEIVQSIEGIANQRIEPGKTLLFLDEVQNSVSAIKILRYFHEEMPELHVVAAGSLLEVRMRREGWSFPVGRVEFLYLYPVSFDEFLSALGENILFDMLLKCPIDGNVPAPLHDKLMNLVIDYMVVGGMPEAVAEYISSRNYITARKIQEGLTLSFKEDFAKYSKEHEVEYLKLVWDKVPYEVGSRIKYSRLSGTEARSRDISRAFDILHEAMIVERVFPTTRTKLPLVTKQRAAPKAICLDIGLCTQVLRLTRDQLKENLAGSAYSGGLAECMVGQELLALNLSERQVPHFWIRDEKDSLSEVDYLVQFENKLVPIEVKSGSHGSLKSLHQFLYRSGTDFGIRIYNGPLNLNEVTVSLPDGKPLKYRLLSVPLYLAFRLRDFCGVH